MEQKPLHLACGQAAKMSQTLGTLGVMSFPKFLGKKYSLIRRNKYGIEDR
jgi:hypothetical protein